jgi:hypothetical protein
MAAIPALEGSGVAEAEEVVAEMPAIGSSDAITAIRANSRNWTDLRINDAFPDRDLSVPRCLLLCRKKAKSQAGSRAVSPGFPLAMRNPAPVTAYGAGVAAALTWAVKEALSK